MSDVLFFWLSIALSVFLYSTVGWLCMDWYSKSRVELYGWVEFVFVILCGPFVWLFMWKLHRLFLEEHKLHEKVKAEYADETEEE